MIYNFHGVSSEADFDKYQPVFESTMTGFSKLTESSKLNVKPQRISIKTVQRTGTLTDVFKYYKVPGNQMDELALLNNLELTDQVNKGKLIKIIGD